MLLAHNFVILSGQILVNQLKSVEGSTLCELALKYSFNWNREHWTANVPVTIWGDETAQATHRAYPIGSYAMIEGYLETYTTNLPDGKKQTNSHITATYIYPSLPEAEVNRVILVGNSGDAPICRSFESGSTVANFNLAVQKSAKRGGAESDPYWFSIEAWGKTGEICQNYVEKGQRISLLGQMHLKTWTDRSSGLNRHKIIVQCESIRLLAAKQKPDEPQPLNGQEIPNLATETQAAPVTDEPPTLPPLAVEPAAQATEMELEPAANQPQAKRKTAGSRKSKSKAVGSAS